MFVPDIKMKALHGETLQRLLNTATDRTETRGMEWGTSKCHTLSAEPDGQNTSLKLARENLKTKATASYLGITGSATGTEPEASIHRIRSTLKLAHKMRELGLHWGQMTTNNLLGI